MRGKPVVVQRNTKLIHDLKKYLNFCVTIIIKGFLSSKELACGISSSRAARMTESNAEIEESPPNLQMACSAKPAKS